MDSAPLDSRDKILITHNAGVMTLTFNRPKLKNALDSDCWALLAKALIDFETSTEDRVLVLTGAGGEFCSGADLSGNITGDAELVTTKMREVADILTRLHRMPKATIAQVDGVAVGVGMSLALGCDLVVASERSRFGAIFARHGLTPDGGLSWLLPRAVGPHKAKELAMLTRLIDGPEAGRIGLANLVVPVAELEPTVADWSSRIAALPVVVAGGIKDLFDSAWNSTFEEMLERETEAQQRSIAFRVSSS